MGPDNRTCALRVVGHGAGLRVENRVGGGDLNPYLAVAACSPAACTASSTSSRSSRPRGQRLHVRQAARASTLQEARDLLAASAMARAAFGDEVVDHYVNAADVEITAFNAAVTDWERKRGFERL